MKQYVKPETHRMEVAPLSFIAESPHDEIGQEEFGKQAIFWEEEGWEEDLEDSNLDALALVHYSLWDD